MGPGAVEIFKELRLPLLAGQGTDQASLGVHLAVGLFGWSHRDSLLFPSGVLRVSDQPQTGGTKGSGIRDVPKLI